MHVLVRGRVVPGSPFPLSVTAGPAAATRTTVSGPGLSSATAARAAAVTVHTVDACGNPCTAGGAAVAVHVAAAAGQVIRI